MKKIFQRVLIPIASVSLAMAQKPERLIDSIEGPQLYRAYCATCHGKDAKGGGPLASSLKNPPPDLTRYAARHGGRFALAEVRRVISGEDSVQGSHGSKEMPVWGPIFSEVTRDQDLGRVRIDNLARYLQAIQAK